MVPRAAGFPDDDRALCDRILSLDDCLEGTKNNDGPCTTYRESGATLLLKIVWNDFRPYKGLVEPFYYYSPRLIGDSYKESLPYYHSYRTSRTLMKAHGIKIAVLVSGSFHQFQVLPFLITLTTALGLLAVATTVVDSLMLYVLPEKEHYQHVKYEVVQGEVAPSSSSPVTLRRILGQGWNEQQSNDSTLELLTTNHSNDEDGERAESFDDERPPSADLREPLLSTSSDEPQNT